MIYFRILILLGAIVHFGACAKKDPSHSHVSVQFDESYFTSKSSHSVTKTDGKTYEASGADWGLKDPLQLSEIGCYAVFVGGPESGLNHSYCELGSGDRISFGPLAGLFSIRSKGSISVPAGENRRIFLVGMASANGRCDSNLAVSKEIDEDNFSSPFLIGATTANLIKSEETIEIELKHDFSNSRKITDCNFMGERELDLVGYPSKRKLWIRENSIPRTIKIEHKGDSIRCSRDGGTTFGSCDSDSTLVWTPNQYNNQHVVEITLEDGRKVSRTFTPSQVYPGVSFIPQANCTVNIDSSYSSFSSVQSALSGHGSTVCLDSDVVLTGNITAATSLGNNLQIVGRHAEDPALRPVFDITDTTSVPGTSNLFSFTPSTTSSLKISGLKIHLTNGTGSLLHARNSSSLDPVYIVLSEVDFHSENGMKVLNLRNQSTNIFDVEINGSVLSSANSTRPLIEAENSNISLNVVTSQLHSDLKVLSLSSTTARFEESLLRGKGRGTGTPIHLTEDVAIHFERSKVHTGSPKALVADCSSGSHAMRLTLNENIFVRLNSGSSTENDALWFSPQANGCTYTVDSNAHNLFCNEDSDQRSFTDIVQGTINSGSFAPGSYTAMDCSAAD